MNSQPTPQPLSGFRSGLLKGLFDQHGRNVAPVLDLSRITPVGNHLHVMYVTNHSMKINFCRSLDFLTHMPAASRQKQNDGRGTVWTVDIHTHCTGILPGGTRPSDNQMMTTDADVMVCIRPDVLFSHITQLLMSRGYIPLGVPIDMLTQLKAIGSHCARGVLMADDCWMRRCILKITGPEENGVYYPASDPKNLENMTSDTTQFIIYELFVAGMLPCLTSSKQSEYVLPCVLVPDLLKTCYSNGNAIVRTYTGHTEPQPALVSALRFFSFDAITLLPVSTAMCCDLFVKDGAPMPPPLPRPPLSDITNLTDADLNDLFDEHTNPAALSDDDLASLAIDNDDDIELFNFMSNMDM
jgi:hypothetical protein